jgi:hypothetical protein
MFTDINNLSLKNIKILDSSSFASNIYIVRSDNVFVENIFMKRVKSIGNWTAGILFHGENLPKKLWMNNIILDSLETISNMGGITGVNIMGADAIINNLSITNSISPEFGVFQYGNLECNIPATLKMSNCLIANNYCYFGDFHGSVTNFCNVFDNRKISISNLTIANNHILDSALGLVGNADIRNSIFYNPEIESELWMPYVSEPLIIPNYSVDLDYSLIRGGMDNINYENNHNFIYGDYNIASSPLFAGESNLNPDSVILSPADINYYKLSSVSPCINTGSRDTNGIYVYPVDLAGNVRVWDDTIDMGCFEYGSIVENDDTVIIHKAPSVKVYPNPILINKQYLPYLLFDLSEVKNNSNNYEIKIYNIKGQRIKTLSGSSKSLKSNVMWNLQDDNYKTVASGIYIYMVFMDNKFIKSSKITVLK